jgi:hypothetical protein
MYSLHIDRIYAGNADSTFCTPLCHLSVPNIKGLGLNMVSDVLEGSNWKDRCRTEDSDCKDPPVWAAYKISCQSTSIVTAEVEYVTEISLVPVL